MATSADPPAGPPAASHSARLNRVELGMWSWAAHRITGVLTFFFLFAHVLDTALVRVSPDAYDKVVNLYKNPLVNLLELGLVGAVVYHALNGLRLMLVDFWSQGPRFQRLIHRVVVVAWLVVMVPSAYFILRYSVEQLFGGN